MANTVKAKTTSSTRSGRPALTPDAKQNTMIAKAINLAEKQIDEGTASSQIITHYLELGSPQARAKAERIELENELIKAKIEALRKGSVIEELMKEAINAMKEYGGHDDGDEEEY